MSKLKKLCENLSNTKSGIPESQKTRSAYDKMYTCIEKQRMPRVKKNDLYSHALNYAMWKEIDGFEYGFKYAVSLIIESVSN